MKCYNVLDRREVNDFQVRLGEHDLTQPSNDVVDFSVDSLTRHSQYNSVSQENDIALIKLKGTVTFTDNIRPICLPSAALILKDEPALVAGKQISKMPTPDVTKLFLLQVGVN